MLSQVLTFVLLAGVATAATPASFSPKSSNDLFVAFGNELALNGVLLPKKSTQTAPTIGTAQRLNGTFAIMMVDLDIPSRNGGPTSQLLHWLQTDLVSANTSTAINGMKVFELINPTNVAASASYLGPSPPNRAPVSHRYTQILLETTGFGSMGSLKQAGASRGNFSAATVIQKVGAKVIAGNSFNVTSEEALAGGAGSTGNSTGNGTASGDAKKSPPGTDQSNTTVTTGSPPIASAGTETSPGESASTSALPSGAEQVGRGLFFATVMAIATAFLFV